MMNVSLRLTHKKKKTDLLPGLLPMKSATRVTKWICAQTQLIHTVSLFSAIQKSIRTAGKK